VSDCDAALLKEQMMSVAREASADRLVVGPVGNLSVRLGDRVMITPHGVSLSQLKVEDILTIDLKGETLEGTGIPSMDTSLHLAIYQNLKASAVIHTHPLFTNALALADVEICPLTIETAFILRKMPIVRQTGLDLFGIAGEIVESLRKSDVVVVKHHGVIAIGDTLQDTLVLSQLLEENSMLMAISRMLGVASFPAVL
jgi:L-fuculose-phosphate aldolase